MTRPNPPDRTNIQGLVFSAFGKFKAAQVILRRDGAYSNINAFVGELLPLVQSGADWGDNRPQQIVNLSFTFPGLVATRVPMIRWDMFPIEFRIGPTSYYAQQNLFDLGSSAPENWVFGNDETDKQVDLIVHCWGADQLSLDALVQKVNGAAVSHGLVEILPLADPPGRYERSPDLEPGMVHFGYRDGMDQPELSWPDPWPNPDNGKNYTPPEALNNFVVGYPDSLIMPGPTLFKNPNDPTSTFARDGCYNAFRVFYQDEKAFETFLDSNAAAVSARLGKSMDFAREWIAAKINGRWRNGSPLVVSPDAPDESTATATDFTFRDDMQGLRCPFSSHTRATNPRDQELFFPSRPLPLILRRGMAYGAKGIPPEYEGERGLIGMFLCGSLGEQFEKMSQWMNVNNFSPVFTLSEQDPISSNRDVPLATKVFTIPMPDGPPVKLDLSGYQFVITRGTAYGFMPSLKALEMIAETNSIVNG